MIAECTVYEYDKQGYQHEKKKDVICPYTDEKRDAYFNKEADSNIRIVCKEI